MGRKLEAGGEGGGFPAASQWLAIYSALTLDKGIRLGVEPTG